MGEGGRLAQQAETAEFKILLLSDVQVIHKHCTYPGAFIHRKAVHWIDSEKDWNSLRCKARQLDHSLPISACYPEACSYVCYSYRQCHSSDSHRVLEHQLTSHLTCQHRKGLARCSLLDHKSFSLLALLHHFCSRQWARSREFGRRFLITQTAQKLLVQGGALHTLAALSPWGFVAVRGVVEKLS